jgi:hypothetical protein
MKSAVIEVVLQKNMFIIIFVKFGQLVQNQEQRERTTQRPQNSITYIFTKDNRMKLDFYTYEIID